MNGIPAVCFPDVGGFKNGGEMGGAKLLKQGLLEPRRKPGEGAGGKRRTTKIGALIGNGQSDGLRNVPISRPRAGRDSRRRASRLRYAASARGGGARSTHPIRQRNRSRRRAG